MQGLELDANLLGRRLVSSSFGGQSAGIKRRPYLPDAGLSAAAALAVLLGQPLLLSGLPGVGKTGAAYHIAARLLGAGAEPIRITVTTQTSGRDLLYKFDLLGRFHQKELPLRRFLRFEALGRAIIAACGGKAEVLDAATDDLVTDRVRIAEIVGNESREDGPLLLRELLQPADHISDVPEASVVLIDEIDKAPRDTPNDLLESFEAMRFTIEELGLKVGWRINSQSDAEIRKSRPIIVATTNAENNLPDAFLRRCVFHEIAMPTADQMKKIISEHLRLVDGLDEGRARELSETASEIGIEVANRVKGVSRAPGTAEYIALARIIATSPVVAKSFSNAGNRSGQQEIMKAALGVMVKTAEDLAKAVSGNLPAVTRP